MAVLDALCRHSTNFCVECLLCTVRLSTRADRRAGLQRLSNLETLQLAAGCLREALGRYQDNSVHTYALDLERLADPLRKRLVQFHSQARFRDDEHHLR